MERYFPISFKLKYNQMKPWLSKYFIRLNRDYNQGGKWVHWRCSGCSCCDAVNDPACLCGHAASIPYPAQELRIWHCYSYGIDHSSSSDSCLLARNFPMPQRVAGKKKKCSGQEMRSWSIKIQFNYFRASWVCQLPSRIARLLKSNQTPSLTASQLCVEEQYTGGLWSG